MNKLLLLDIDGMFYHSIGKETLEECMITFREKLQNCLDKTECTHWVGFVGKGKTFRNSISSDYKANRTQEPPKYLAALKEWGIAEFNLYVCKGFEADDAVNYFYNKDICISDTTFETREMLESALDLCKSDKYPTFEFESVEVVMASPDKDLLQGIPSKTKHFNYSYKLQDKADLTSVVKGWFVETSIEDSYRFKAKQLLMGDSADGISCLKGVGEKGAEKILQRWENSNIESFLLDYYLEFYDNSAKAIFEFQKNYRLLHLLDCNEDFYREIGELPMFPEIRQVPTKPIEEVKDELTF
jgi:5'-3' exonuclease